MIKGHEEQVDIIGMPHMLVTVHHYQHMNLEDMSNLLMKKDLLKLTW
jgi:hypothetical protein